MSGQPTEADIAAMLADALHREFGAFLAHDPHDADRFWGSTARSVAAALRPLLTDTADAHRDLVKRLGFGDNITEPMADNDTIVRWFDEQGQDASEWREHERWRDDCYAAGHPDDEDCAEHGPSCCNRSHFTDTADARAAGAREDAAWVELDRRLAAEQRLAAVLDVVEMYESCGPKQQSTRDVLAAVRAALAADTVTETERPLWRCDHWMHDVERCTPTKHYGRA